jgi:hypothetical protein
MENNAHGLQKCPEPPWSIYVCYEKGRKRVEWFNKYKKEGIEKVTTPLLRGYEDVFFIYYPVASKFIGILEELLANEQVQGIRMCFGVDAFSDPPKRGKLDIVMAPGRLNSERKLQDIRALYTRASTLEKLDYASAKKMTEYYKTNIVPKLQNTLSEDDIAKEEFETENVYFKREYLELFIRETKCQVEKVKIGVKGIKILFVSYHDIPDVTNSGIPLTKRLTIQFVYTDKNGTSINLEKTDLRYENIPENFGNFDTGDPTPPFDNYSDI